MVAEVDARSRHNYAGRRVTAPPLLFMQQNIFDLPQAMQTEWRPWDAFPRAAEQVIDREARAQRRCAGPIRFAYEPTIFGDGVSGGEFATADDAIEWTRKNPNHWWQLRCTARATGVPWEETHGES